MSKIDTAALEQCRRARTDPNVSAFLRVLRSGESSQTPDAYRMMFGGSLVNSLADHPRTVQRLGGIASTAAGAYQFLQRTWDECVAALGLGDFGPEAQDLAAVYLIRRRGALADVLAGRIPDALSKCAAEWASLPGSPYGQPTISLQSALATYRQFGGLDRPASAPEPAPAPPPPAVAPSAQADYQAKEDAAAGDPAEYPAAPATTEETTMAPWLIGLAGTLIERFAPLAQEKLQREIGRHTGQEAAGQIAEAVIDTAKALTGKADPVEAIAAAKASPAIVAQIEESALDRLARMMPVLERLAQFDADEHTRVENSRRAAAERGSAEAWDMSRALVMGAFALIGVLVLFVGVVAIVQASKGDIKPEVWAQVAGLIGFATGVGTTIYAYRFGTSRSSAAKDVMVRELVNGQTTIRNRSQA